MEFYTFRLMVRKDDINILQRARMLLNQYCVDILAKVIIASFMILRQLFPKPFVRLYTLSLFSFYRLTMNASNGLDTIKRNCAQKNIAIYVMKSTEMINLWLRMLSFLTFSHHHTLEDPFTCMEKCRMLLPMSATVAVLIFSSPSLTIQNGEISSLIYFLDKMLQTGMISYQECFTLS